MSVYENSHCWDHVSLSEFSYCLYTNSRKSHLLPQCLKMIHAYRHCFLLYIFEINLNFMLEICVVS